MDEEKGNMGMNWKRKMKMSSWEEPDLRLSMEDKVLWDKIGEFIIAERDIEEVKNDPMFAETYENVNSMIRDRKISDVEADAEDRNFIIQGLVVNEDNNHETEINEIKEESSRKGIDKVTSEWVKDWNKKTGEENGNTGHRKEIRDFVSQSLESEKSIPERNKTIPIRWIIASAAAILGAVFLLRSLLPGNDPDRIFTRYYEPMNIVSSVTRGVNATVTDSYALAVESYKAHNYQEAANGFSLAAKQDYQAGPADFFLGISQIAAGNYRDAAATLEKVVTGQGEYVKDATWYLGLAYIKTGESQKARICFETLSRTPGFYRDRSTEILRRLK